MHGGYGEGTVQGGLYAGVGEVREPWNVRGEGRIANVYQLLLFEGGVECVYVYESGDT